MLKLNQGQIPKNKPVIPPLRTPTPDMFRGQYGIANIYEGAFGKTLNPLSSGRGKKPGTKTKKVSLAPTPRAVKETIELKVNKNIR